MSKQDGGAKRYNAGKLPMHLVPPSMLKAFAEVMQLGAVKYGERNWERGFNYSIPYACALRHLVAWWSGEDKDAESGVSHLKHVLTNVAMLVEFLETYPQGDDRPNGLGSLRSPGSEKPLVKPEVEEMLEELAYEKTLENGDRKFNLVTAQWQEYVGGEK